MYSDRMSGGGGVWLKNNIGKNGLKWLKTHFKTNFVFFKKSVDQARPPPPLWKISTQFIFFWRLPLVSPSVKFFHDPSQTLSV